MITQEQIERKVERYIDHLDRVYLARQIDQKTYDAGIREISEWAEAKYAQAEIWECARRRVWGDEP